MIFTDKKYMSEAEMRKLSITIVELILLMKLIDVSFDMSEMTVAYKLHWEMDTEKKILTVDYDGNNQKILRYGENYSGIFYDINSIIDPDDI